jgi:branched-chain amino acid transport system ATP-binding protein
MVFFAERVAVSFGREPVVREASFSMACGEIVAVHGALGAGKTTLLRGLAGLLPLAGGRALLGGEALTGRRAFEIARAGLVLCSEGRRVLEELSVEENLRLGGLRLRLPHVQERGALESLYRRFPVLGERRAQRAGLLSGGEQQMLAVARSLMSRPRVLLMDEPTLGLALGAAEELLETLRHIASEGVAILVTQQDDVCPRAHAVRAYRLQDGVLVARSARPGDEDGVASGSPDVPRPEGGTT